MKKHMLRPILTALAVLFTFPASPAMAADHTEGKIEIHTVAPSVTETSADVVLNESTTIRITGYQETDKISYRNQEIPNGGSLPGFGYFYLHSVSAVDRSGYTEYIFDAEPIYAIYYSIDTELGAPLETAYYLAGATVTLPTPTLLPSQENVTFTGWMDSTGAIVDSLTLTEDTTLQASFSVPGDLRKIASVKVNPFPHSTRLEEITDALPKTVTLLLDHGTDTQASVDWTAETDYDPTLSGEQEISFCGTVALPENITNTAEIETQIHTTVTVYGAEASTYTLTYDPNGGTGDLPAPASYEAGERVLLCPGATKPHSRFLGWSTTPDSSYANAGSASITMPSHDVILYAIYADQTSFCISFDMGGSNILPPEPLTVYENEPAVLPFDLPLAESGSVFAGWSSTPDAREAEYTAATAPVLSVEEDTTLYAVYEPLKNVSVSYDLNGGTGTVPKDDRVYHAGDSVPVRFLMPARENHTFLGWSFQEDAYTADFQADGNTAFPMPNHDVTLYAVWRSNETYTVTYDLNGGAGECPADSRSYYTGDSVQPLFSPAPEKSHAAFLGWAASPSAHSPAFSNTGESSFQIGTSDVILYAVYQEDSYLTLQYDANGGTGAPKDPSHYYAGDSVKVNLTELPSYYAHKFLGWAESPDATAPDYSAASLTSFTALPGSSLKVLYAVWDVETPKRLTYDLNGTEVERCPLDQTAYYQGDTAFLDFSIVPKDPNVAFLGWAKTKDAFEPYYTRTGKNSLPVASQDITLYALFERSTDLDGTVKITYSPGTGRLKALYEPGRKKPDRLKYTWIAGEKTLAAGSDPSYSPTAPGSYRVLLSDPSGTYTGTVASDAIPLSQVTCSSPVELDSPSGLYAKGNLVHARAKIASESLRFQAWTASGITLSSSQKTGNPLSFPMGEKDVALSYSTAKLYTVKVSGGAASAYSCTEGTSVSIQASNVSGRSFEKWAVSGNVSLSDVSSPKASFTMPAANVTISAVFQSSQSAEIPAREGTRKEADADAGEPLIFTVLSDGGMESANIRVIHQEQGPLCRAVFQLARNGFTLYEDYYSITILDSTPPVYETDQSIRLQIRLPSDLQKTGRTFRMICVSRFGIPYVFEDLDSNDATITIETNHFYAYALCYSDDYKPQEESVAGQISDRAVSEMHPASEADTLTPPALSILHSSSESQTAFLDADCIGYTTTEKSTAMENAADTTVHYHSM